MFVQYVGGTSWRKVDYRSGVGWVAFLRTSTLFSSIAILILSISPLSPSVFFCSGMEGKQRRKRWSWIEKAIRNYRPHCLCVVAGLLRLRPQCLQSHSRHEKDPLWKFECWAEPFKLPGRVALAFFTTFVAGWESEVDACTKLIWWNH